MGGASRMADVAGWSLDLSCQCLFFIIASNIICETYCPAVEDDSIPISALISLTSSVLYSKNRTFMRAIIGYFIVAPPGGCLSWAGYIYSAVHIGFTSVSEVLVDGTLSCS